jgi:hypothetical protein
MINTTKLDTQKNRLQASLEKKEAIFRQPLFLFFSLIP